MSASSAHDYPTLVPSVKAVLGQLRRRIRQYVWLEGCAAAVAWLGLAFWATLAIDWFFEPPVVVRETMLVLIGALLAVVLVQRIGRRAFVRISDSNAAMVLERRFPQLGDCLLTAVALSGRPAEASEIDPQMLARTCRQAAARLGNVDLEQVFDRRPLRRTTVAAGSLALSVVIFAAVCHGAFGVWVHRTLGLSDQRWPRYTRLEVEGFPGGIQKVARGADLEIVARADMTMPRVPEVVEVRYWTDGGGRGRATMERRGVARGSGDKFQEYAYTFHGVLNDIRFDVVGGDDRVDDRWIQVVDSPTISRMTLDCELPAYIGRRQPPLPVSGVMQIPMGSRIVVRAGAANKDLVQVQVTTIVEDRDAAQPPATASAELAGPPAEEASLAADHRGFSYALPPLMKDTTLLFTLTDSDGIKGREPVRLVLVPLADQPPQMAVQLDGIGTAVTPQARIPAAGRITDDYGLGRVWFEHAVDEQKSGRHAIREFNDHPATEFNPVDAALELKGLGLKPGQKISLSVKAADRCDLGHGPNVSSSERWTLDVVTPEQLRTMLESRELVLRQRFDEMIREMTDTRDLLARLDFAPPLKTKLSPASGHKSAAEPGDEEPADSPERQSGLRLLRVEGTLTNCRKSTQEVLGVAEAFDDIRKQLVNNRIDTEELKSRLQSGIADPLRTIATRMFPELERRLEGLKAVLEDVRQAPGRRDVAQQQADEILVAMQKVRNRMLELESFNEALDLLRGIIQTQEELRQETQQRHKEKIRDLLKE